MSAPEGRVSGPPGHAPSERRWATAVVLLVDLSLALFVAHVAFTGDTYQDCRYPAPSVWMYVTAWAAPVCALAAPLLIAVAARRAGGDEGDGGGVTANGRGRLAAGSVCVVPVLLLVELAVLCWTYAPDPAGGAGCSGMGLPGGL